MAVGSIDCSKESIRNALAARKSGRAVVIALGRCIVLLMTLFSCFGYKKEMIFHE